jgi:hypothetical protein
MIKPLWPTCLSTCADCGLGTCGEWYMVHEHVWEEAWRGRRKPWHAIEGQEILCIGCLERRLGRTLVAADFTDAPVNDPSKSLMSARLHSRLIATE